MATGLSIHIGLNAVDPDHYDGWDGQLVACEFDAEDMTALASDRGFETRTLLTKEATSAAILDAIADSAPKLGAGDILFLTYSGHGGQLPDSNSDEDDRTDETWCAFDRQIADDELYSAWGAFPADARVFVLSDSCHSGTVTKAVVGAMRPEALRRAAQLGDSEPEQRMKAMPTDIQDRTYRAHKDDYDAIQAKVPAFDKSPLEASVLLISGCQDNQTSADGEKNGLFTQTLLQVWDEGNFRGSNRSFAKKIVEKMPFMQTPNFFSAGNPSREFERQQPFTI
jgi:hypothetical protein